jgi:hypothetical protein
MHDLASLLELLQWEIRFYLMVLFVGFFSTKRCVHSLDSSQ